MGAVVAEGGERGDVIGFRAGFLEDLPGAGDYDCVCGYYQGGFSSVGIVDFGGVDGGAFLGGGLQDVFEGGKGFGEVFGEGGGDCFEGCEAYLFGSTNVLSETAVALGNDECRLTWASNCFRRGDAEASMTLLSRIACITGSSSGRGARNGGGFETAG